MFMNPLLACDFYKVGHVFQYPENTTLVYSNLTPRKSRIDGIGHMVFFGLQYFIKDFLINQFNNHFFQRPLSVAIDTYKSVIESGLGPNAITYDHIAALHKLGYLPILIKALPEGSRVPMRVPVLTVRNTLPEFYWLPNFFETILSAQVWQACTSATLAYEFKKIFDEYANITVGDNSFCQWQGHDFSFRGMSSLETACLSGAGHLLSFTGTDTIPALHFLNKYYNAPLDTLIGGSVPATEHSVMCAGGKDDEVGTFKRLITEVYPSGIVSIVSDTWDLWDVLTKYAPYLKEEILNRDGKVVFRPDSGNPADILCGDPNAPHGHPASLGVIEILWDVFGGSMSEKGYRLLNPKVGAIYGDSITLERAKEINQRLMDKGFASTNWVAGIGSYTYQYNTRDTFGTAMKATYVEIGTESREIWKDPITDDGTKKSAKGLLRVLLDDNGDYVLQDQVSPAQEITGHLYPVFDDGKLLIDNTLSDIRARLWNK